jgi:ADP-L-glycero-D-manno-heptose 6-epimerase
MHGFTRGRVVVTGGAGLIGSCVVWELNRRGHDNILVVDRLDESEKWKNLVPLRFADYMDADAFLACVNGASGTLADVTCVIHLGACSATTERDAGYLMRNNYDYSKAVAQWALGRNLRLVYASSAATYGSLEKDLSDTADLRDLRPLNGYAFSKHLFDLYAQRQGWLDHICGIKYFNIFGPNEEHKGDMRSVVNKAYCQIVQTGGATLFKSYRSEFKNGEQERDFLYVKDAAAATVHLAQAGTKGIVNVGSGQARTWLDLVRPIFGALNLPERITFVDMPEALRGKYQYSTCAKIDRLRGSGFDAPFTPLHEAVRDYVTNYLVPDRRLDPADVRVAVAP